MLLCLAILSQCTLAMLLTINPAASVDVSIWPKEGTMAMLLVLDVVSLVALPIGPAQDSVAIHLVSPPHSDILTPILPLIAPFALNVVVFKVSLIAITVGPCEGAETHLYALFVVPFELGTVWPALNTPAILCVILPVTAIQGAILVEIVAVAMGFVIQPFSLVNVAVSMKEAPEVVSLVL